MNQNYLFSCISFPYVILTKWITRESEYAAWTLVNGYALNHVTISTHRLKSHLRNIKNLNKFIEDNGFKLNSEGGILKGLFFPSNMWLYVIRNFKLYLPFISYYNRELTDDFLPIVKTVSPDGLLQQSSTVADSTTFHFIDGVVESIPRSYIEFAERLVLPQYKNLSDNEVSVTLPQISCSLTWF